MHFSVDSSVFVPLFYPVSRLCVLTAYLHILYWWLIAAFISIPPVTDPSKRAACFQLWPMPVRNYVCEILALIFVFLDDECEILLLFLFSPPQKCKLFLVCSKTNYTKRNYCCGLFIWGNIVSSVEKWKTFHSWCRCACCAFNNNKNLVVWIYTEWIRKYIWM